MSRYKYLSTHDLHFITLTVVDWLDVFTRPEYKHLITSNLQVCRRNMGLVVHAYVVMSNHVHLIVSATGTLALHEIITRYKSFTAKELLKAIANNPQESRKEMLRIV